MADAQRPHSYILMTGEGGGGGPKDFLGFEILVKRDFLGPWFWKIPEFFELRKNTGIYFGITQVLSLAQINNNILVFCVQFAACVGIFWVYAKNWEFLGIQYEPHPLPPPAINKISEWGPWGLMQIVCIKNTHCTVSKYSNYNIQQNTCKRSIWFDMVCFAWVKEISLSVLPEQNHR